MFDGVVEGLAKRRAEPMEDPGMMVAAISWMLLVAMVIIVILRFALKLAKSTNTPMFGLDDVFVGLAAVSTWLNYPDCHFPSGTDPTTALQHRTNSGSFSGSKTCSRSTQVRSESITALYFPEGTSSKVHGRTDT